MSVATAQSPTSAAEKISEFAHRQVELPIIGRVAVPPPDKLAYYAGIGLLAVLQVIEWPLALVITAGHVLGDQHMSRLARGVGEALQEA